MEALAEKLFVSDDDLARLPDVLIAQLSREARKRAKKLQHLPWTDDMAQMLDDLNAQS